MSPGSPLTIAHFMLMDRGVIVQLAEQEPDAVTMTSSVILWAVSDRGGNRGQSVTQGPMGAHNGLGGAHKGPAHES